MPPEPINKKLYEQVKREAKKKFAVWPSAYASGWLVREYKKRGGKYKGKKPQDSGLQRWFDEEWVNVCEPKKNGQYKPCGRPKGGTTNYAKKYPYCRPKNRVNSRTPKTAGELTKKDLVKRCSIKRSKKNTRVTPSRLKKK